MVNGFARAVTLIFCGKYCCDKSPNLIQRRYNVEVYLCKNYLMLDWQEHQIFVKGMFQALELIII